MNSTHLHQIAVDATCSHGLLPEFSPQALQEAEATRQTGLERNRDSRDRRHLTWLSIDNDDTRDLDQLGVTEPLKVKQLKVALLDQRTDGFTPLPAHTPRSAS